VTQFEFHHHTELLPLPPSYILPIEINEYHTRPESRYVFN